MRRCLKRKSMYKSVWSYVLLQKLLASFMVVVFCVAWQTRSWQWNSSPIEFMQQLQLHKVSDGFLCHTECVQGFFTSQYSQTDLHVPTQCLLLKLSLENVSWKLWCGQLTVKLHLSHHVDGRCSCVNCLHGHLNASLTSPCKCFCFGLFPLVVKACLFECKQHMGVILIFQYWLPSRAEFFLYVYMCL